MSSLLDLIKEKGSHLPPKQYELAKFLINNYSSLQYANTVELARMASVSEATIIRLAYSLGFKGFPELQQAIRDLVKENSSISLNRYALRSFEELKDCAFATTFELEKRILEEAYASIDKESFESAVEMICKAPCVLVVGTSFNESLAHYAGNYLHVLKENVRIITDLGAKEYQVLQEIPRGTVGLVYSFPRYPRKTQSVVEFLKKKKVPMIGITDNVLSPIASRVEKLFLVPQQFITFIDPYAAVMALTHSLLLGVFMNDPEKSRRRVRDYDRFLQSENVHLRDSVDISNLI
ncbi:MAG: MurR/RpiR family transcriptional regulator [Synergistales bacterium]|jgi:DNA-binding MurR/RpiR family transcriptional regulator